MRNARANLADMEPRSKTSCRLEAIPLRDFKIGLKHQKMTKLSTKARF